MYNSFRLFFLYIARLWTTIDLFVFVIWYSPCVRLIIFEKLCLEVGHLTKCTYPFIRNSSNYPRITVDVTAFIFTYVAKKKHRYIVESATDVTRIIDIIIWIFKDRLFWLNHNHLPIMLSNLVILLATIRTFAWRLSPKFNTLKTKCVRAGKSSIFLRQSIQTDWTYLLRQHHNPPPLQLWYRCRLKHNWS
jgi:hypothetical protein